MVAPDRETPGMSAKHCTDPMMRASFQVTVSSPRSSVPLASAHHRTALHPMRPATTTQRLRNGPSMASWRASPTNAMGMEPMMTFQPMR